jgi:hypothetical protein
MAGYLSGVENGLLDEVRSSDLAGYGLKMAAGCFKDLRDDYKLRKASCS